MLLRFTLGAVAILACAAPALAQKPGQNGTTLAASKTIDICSLDDQTWLYSGEVSVWNEGVLDTVGLAIKDCIQHKITGKFADVYCAASFDPAPTSIPAGTTKETATVFKYTITGAPLPGDIRNAAAVTILNHSGSLGKAKGPEPKATWNNGAPPPCDFTPDGLGCTLTQGYWGNKPGVTWPGENQRADPFFASGYTWQQILDASAGGNGYIILAKQYIAAVLNHENGAHVPSGVQGVLDFATGFFSGTTTPGLACPSPSSCGPQKTWGAILDSYNNGEYPGGPLHCTDE